MPRITFKPFDITVEVASGENLLRAALMANIGVRASCGGDGTCGKCRMIVESGNVEFEPTPKLTTEQIDRGHVLACRTTVVEDTTVLVPEESRLAAMPEHVYGGREINPVLTDEEQAARLPRRTSPPPVTKRLIRMRAPNLSDAASDADRVLLGLRKTQGISSAKISLPALRELPAAAREGDWTVTAFTAEPCDSVTLVSGFQAGDATDRQYAVAVDVGTTTIEIALLDLADGRVMAQHSEYNAQVALGDDVISRIIASTKPGGLGELTRLAVETIRSLVEHALDETGVSPEDIVAYYLAGNTVMTHLLLGITPANIRTSPHVPAVSSFPWVNAGELGLPSTRATRAIALPCPASWLGGDVVAGVVAAGMPWSDKLTLFIDVGTNGEIVLGSSDWMVACSCSAGPAFEGGGIRHGMRASAGAIEQVRIDDKTLEPNILTIGQVPPLGICGSGLIDCVSELFLCGALERTGSYRTDINSPHLRRGEHGLEYVLATADKSGTGEAIVLTEVDIDNLLRAKAAIFAGISVLVETLDLPLDAIEEVVIAGGFGRYLDLERVTALGMVPELSAERFVFLGNGSLMGARLAAQSREVLHATRTVAEMLTYIELAAHVGFMDHYTSGLFLPHTSLELFANVERVRDARIAGGAVV